MRTCRGTRCLSLTTLLGFLRAEDAAGTGGEKLTFLFGPVALGRGVGRFGVGGDKAGGFRAGGFRGKRGLPLRGGSGAVSGNSESTGFSRSTETESVLEPIWREKYLGERETTK